VTLARFVLVYALSDCSRWSVYVAMERSLYSSPWRFRSFGRVLELSRVGATVVLFVGALGLLKWKPWRAHRGDGVGRADDLAGLGSAVLSAVEYSNFLATATPQLRAANPAFWKSVVWQRRLVDRERVPARADLAHPSPAGGRAALPARSDRRIRGASRCDGGSPRRRMARHAARG
jgi:hypothetical protein